MFVRNMMLWLAGNETMKRALLRTRVSRALASRFVAGETLRDALAAARTLNQSGASVTLDYLGENVTTQAEARAVVTTYQTLLRAIAQEQLNCNVSLKLTALGLDQDREFCTANLRDILDVARESGNFIRIDMEGSAYTQVTLDIFEELYVGQGYGNVGIVLQAYLYRTAADVQRANQLRARVRLCKGAYREPPSVAFPRKADVDRNYIALAQDLLQNGNYPGLATHDPNIINWTRDFVRLESIERARYEFQMLYGIRRDLQRQLLADGYNLRIYVPYGDAWYPYLMRRMAERPANLLFVLRALRHG